ncbi:sensor histidine kinase [Pseudoxanthomonas sp. UTMC 1351]|uniref:sensor histidine kinase n=1 Tax=Pseudoxanthomonas sp. UTMC 1351 TaxID=2695853 RepID=UPI0034CE37B8
MRFPWLRPKSLRGRLFRDTLLAFLLASGFYVVVLHEIFREGSDLMVRDGLTGQAEDLADALRFDPDGKLGLDLHQPMKWGYDAYFQNLKYRVLDSNGKVLFSSDGSSVALTPPGKPLRLGDDYFQTGDGMYVATYPTKTQAGQLYIQTARSDRFFELTAEAMLPVVVETSTAVGAIALVLFGVVILVGLKFSLAPVRRASRDVEAISSQNLSTRISTRDMPVEIRPMVDGINRSLGRIEDAFQVQQRFLANAAHELKTPLSILRGQLEIRVKPEERAAMLWEIDSMARTVNQLLQLAEASDIGSYRFERVDLANVTQEAVALVRSLADERIVDIELKTASPPHDVRGDRAAIQVALRNVLENAIRHSPQKSLVELRLDGNAVSVRDMGAGLSQDIVPHLFERFWRLDRSGSSTGLGLSIVKEIMDAHHGDVHAGNAQDGPGALFTLCFPRASD